jgi:purine-binding chemotaxis protein CheW
MSNDTFTPSDAQNSYADDDSDFDTGEDSRYLLFKVGTDAYATPLLGVREVLETQTPKPVPNTAPHFKGLINVRGQIMGVVDLRVRFNYPEIEGPTNTLMLFETETGPIAAVVDRVDAVVKVDERDLNKNPNIRSQIPIEYLLGATTYQGNLVTLIDLNKTLCHDDYVQIQKAKIAAIG